MTRPGRRSRRWSRRWLLVAISVVAAIAVGAGGVFLVALRGDRQTLERDAYISDYRTTGGNEIVLVVIVGPRDEVLAAEATETSTTVTVSARYRPYRPGQPSTDAGVARRLTVPLTAPVGSRRVVTTDGRTVIEVR